jgi:hypothetical protein
MNFKNCNAMKKIFTKMMLWAVAATAMVSCANDVNDAMVNGGELTQKITLSAEKPATVRTEMEGTTPYWSKGDKIGVYTAQVDDGKEYTLTNDKTIKYPAKMRFFPYIKEGRIQEFSKGA